MKWFIYLIYTACSISVFNLQLKKSGLTHMFKRYITTCEAMAIIDYNTYSERDLLEINKKIGIWTVVCEQVCRFLPFEAKCVHQSFFLYKIIRKQCKIPVSLVIGVCPYPFSAHAWIMLGNINFFEEEYETSRYNVLLRSESYYEMGQVEH